VNLKALAIVLVPLVVAGCASEPEPTPSESVGAKSLEIVTSTNVWGGIVSELGGDFVSVQTIIESPNQDPHSYEASARDQLAVTKADLVIANGGGYDSFLDQLAESAGKDIFYAVEAEPEAKEEHSHSHSHADEHIWYDFLLVSDVASRLTLELQRLLPKNSDYFESNLVVFLDSLKELEKRSASLAEISRGKKFISTEPVADYLLENVGLESITPQTFSDAIEEERDLAPKDLLEVENLITSKAINLLVVNQQTASNQVLALSDLAKSNGIAVLEMSELRPDSLTYFEWMMDNLNAIEAVLK